MIRIDYKITIPMTWQEKTFDEWVDSINDKLKEYRL